MPLSSRVPQSEQSCDLRFCMPNVGNLAGETFHTRSFGASGHTTQSSSGDQSSAGQGGPNNSAEMSSSFTDEGNVPMLTHITINHVAPKGRRHEVIERATLVQLY